jgi:hypothetical protein
LRLHDGAARARARGRTFPWNLVLSGAYPVLPGTVEPAVASVGRRA